MATKLGNSEELRYYLYRLLGEKKKRLVADRLFGLNPLFVRGLATPFSSRAVDRVTV